MVEFRTEVRIQAPAECVLAVMRDNERWPEWTPTVKRIRRLESGPLAVGSRADKALPESSSSVSTVVASFR